MVIIYFYIEKLPNSCLYIAVEHRKVRMKRCHKGGKGSGLRVAKGGYQMLILGDGQD